MRKASVALVIVVLLATGACGDDEAGGETTTTAAPPATATTGAGTSGDDGAEDEWAIPDEIDEAYVERVLTKLYEIEGDARRLVMRDGEVGAEAIEIVNSVYEQHHATTVINGLSDAAFDGFPNAIAPPGDVRASVVMLVETRQECVIVDVLLNYGEVSEAATESVAVFVGLVPASTNLTGWRINLAGVSPGGDVPDAICGDS